MDQPLYLLLEWAASESGLGWMARSYREEILLFIAGLGFVCWLLGFYFYRSIVSGLVFLGVTLASNLWIKPVWGERPAVTACAVLGVVLGFLAFRWYRLGGVLLCALIAGSWAWQAGAWNGRSVLEGWILVAAAALLAAAAAFWFPLWAICAFTASWGAVVFVEEGWRLWNALPGPGDLSQPLVFAAVLAAGGLAVQLAVFHRQTLFSRIMPKSLEHRLQKHKEKKKVAG